MNKDRKHILLFLIAILLLGACNQESVEVAEPQPMKFTFYLQDGEQVNPVTRARPANINATGISLYCVYHTANFQENTGTGSSVYPRIYWNTPVDSNGNATDGSAPRFWMNSPTAMYSFFAHTGKPKMDYPEVPSGLAVKQWGATPKESSITKQTPVCWFLQPDDPKKQIDFLIADSKKDVKFSYIAPVVGLYFKHLFSRIKIRFYNSHGTQLNDCVASVTYGNNVSRGSGIDIGSGAITLDTSLGKHSGTHSMHDGTLTVKASNTTSDYALLAGDVILLPQTVGDGFITVQLSYRPEGAETQQTAMVDIPVPDSTRKLVTGCAYTYNINVIVEINSLKVGEVTLSSWEGQNSTVVDWTQY